MRLSDLEPGQTAIILKVFGHGAFRKRIMEMGFVRGKRVSVMFNAPLKDPIVYKVMDYEVSLRRQEASMIEVITEEQAAEMTTKKSGGTVRHTTVEHIIDSSKRTINIALVGNPNSGKTSLFNAASGGHEHVGNYGGVTVDAKRGSFKYGGYRFNMYDLPGTYALAAYSPEEVYVRKHLVEQNPDVVVNVVAGSNLERNLYLTTELIDMDCTMVMALNMYDELEQGGAELDYDSLGSLLGMPIVPTVSRGGKSLTPLFDAIIDVYENREPKVRHTHITHSMEVEAGIETLERAIESVDSVVEYFPARYLAIKMLERDREIEAILSSHKSFDEWSKLRDEQVKAIERKLGEDFETAITGDKYGFISGALKETYTPGIKEQIKTMAVIDSFVTNKLFGFPIFIFLMWLMFEATFTLGAYPMAWIESGVALFAQWVEGVMSQGMLRDLIVNGVIGGVGGVIVFLPNILILYLFISFMEDSGYMARAAFIMDKIMHRMGLHGKSFIPLIMGFGCNVPAIMATRGIESHSSRIITILINPFMSCSARIPIYVLLIGTFFPKHGSLVMLSLYFGGILVAAMTAKMLRKFWFKRDETPFVMELPPYRMPTIRATVSHMWDKAALYLRKMGGIILVASIVVWFLSYFPRHDETLMMAHQETTQVVAPDNGAANSSTESVVVTADSSATDSSTESVVVASEESGANSDVAPLVMEIEPLYHNEEISEEQMELLRMTAQQQNSYLGQFGRFITPIMEPLGFNWKISIALVSGVAAKEIVVSTLGVLYADSSTELSPSLSAKLRAVNPETGVPDITSLTAISLLVFALLYFPCLAVLVAIMRETGSWKWAGFSFVYNTTVAWIAAFLVYNIGSLFV